MRLILPAIALATAALAAQAPAPSPEAAVSIRGLVADEGGEPIVNAKISLETSQATVRSDANGQFVLPAPSGLSSARIAKNGYATATLQLGPRTGSVRIALARAAVIAGRVTDEMGEPLARLSVDAELLDTERLTRQRVSGETDDRGEYRIFGLQAGNYLVALPRLAQRRMRTYFPDVLDREQAEPLALKAGDERGGVDFVVPSIETSQVFGTVGNPAARPAPTAPDATGAVRGTVTDLNGRPIARAQVVLGPLQPSQVQNQSTITESDGRFSFDHVPAARYRVVAGKSGYLPGNRDDAVARGTSTFDLAEGTTNNTVTLTLVRWSTLSGQIFDEFGEPLSGARVQLLRLGYEEGRRSLVLAGPSRQTDDAGNYRLFGLAAGDYIVKATIGDAGSDDVPGYATTYFPGTTDPTGGRYVTIRRSDDLSGIDFSLERATTVRLAGTMFNADGRPTMGGGVSLSSSWRSGAVTGAAVGARIPKEGVFDFSNVAPGQYVIQVYSGRRNGFTEGEFGAVTVTAGESDITDLVVRMTRGSSITGQIVFENAGDGPLPPPSSVSIVPVPIDFDLAPPNGWATAAVDRDLGFRLLGISGTRRLEVVSAPRGWALREIRVDGIDVTDQPISFGSDAESLSSVEVRLTHQPSSVAGTVTENNAATASGAPVLIFATDEERWYPRSRYVRMVRSSGDGQYLVEGLPAGPYYAAAPLELPTYGGRAWEDPVFLTSLIRDAQIVTVSDGQRTTLNVKRPTPPRVRR